MPYLHYRKQALRGAKNRATDVLGKALSFFKPEVYVQMNTKDTFLPGNFIC